MKKGFFLIAIQLILAVVFSAGVTAQNVAITNDGSDPDPSAMLDIKADTMGILIPRITKAHRPMQPATGLLIYQTDDSPGFYFYNGTEWKNIAVSGTTGTMAAQNANNVNISGGIINGTDIGMTTAEDAKFDTATAQNINCVNKLKTNSLTIANGATDTYVLTSDATGNATWQAPGGGGAAVNGYIYNFANIITSTIVGGADIDLSNNGILNGIIHTAGTTAIVVMTDGNYKVDYNISYSAGVGATFGLAVNGSVMQETVIPCLTATGLLSGTSILSLAAGDVVTLRNTSATPVTLTLTPNVGTQLTLVKL